MIGTFVVIIISIAITKLKETTIKIKKQTYDGKGDDREDWKIRQYQDDCTESCLT